MINIKYFIVIYQLKPYCIVIIIILFLTIIKKQSNNDNYLTYIFLLIKNLDYLFIYN